MAVQADDMLRLDRRAISRRQKEKRGGQPGSPPSCECFFLHAFQGIFAMFQDPSKYICHICQLFGDEVKMADDLHWDGVSIGWEDADDDGGGDCLSPWLRVAVHWEHNQTIDLWSTIHSYSDPLHVKPTLVNRWHTDQRMRMLHSFPWILSDLESIPRFTWSKGRKLIQRQVSVKFWNKSWCSNKICAESPKKIIPIQTFIYMPSTNLKKF